MGINVHVFLLLPSLHSGVCSPVRHAHDDVLHAVLRGLIDDGFQRRDQGLASLQSEAFLRGPLLLKKLLKPAGTHRPMTPG